MTINSRAKGANGELELAAKLTEHGYPARRTVQHCGKGGDSADVVAEGLEAYHIECKRTERFNLYDAMTQAKRDAKAGRVPTVMHRQSNRPWVVVLGLEDFLTLVKRSS